MTSPLESLSLRYSSINDKGAMHSEFEGNRRLWSYTSAETTSTTTWSIKSPAQRAAPSLSVGAPAALLPLAA